MEEFNYRGYPIKKLTELCDTRFADRGKAPVLFGLPEQYSQGRIFREYARFPEELPLNIYADHGIPINFKVALHELKNNAYAFFTYHEKKYQLLKEQLRKPCYKVPHPLIWYRREHGIEQIENPQGTLFFAVHSTPDVSVFYDIEQICVQLKSLPDEMQPVGVCLFMTDIHNGTFLKYLENGIPVYTAGNVWDIRFVDRFYDLLRRFKFTASNSYGTYLFYSVEMGIPFMYLKQDYYFYNYSDRNLPLGECRTSDSILKMLELFSGVNLKITKQQKKLVEYYVNMENYISREEMFNVLKKALTEIKLV